MDKNPKLKYLVVTQYVDGTPAHIEKFMTGEGVQKYFDNQKNLMDNITIGRVALYKRGTKYWSWRTEATRGCGNNTELIRIHDEMREQFPHSLRLTEYPEGLLVKPVATEKLPVKTPVITDRFSDMDV